MIEDENTSPSEREAAKARVAEREEELARLDPQIQQREEALPWRKRIKNVFNKLREKLGENVNTLKKIGYIVQAVVLATGIAIGAASLAIVNALKDGRQKVGLPFTRFDRLDRQLHLQIDWTGSLLPR